MCMILYHAGKAFFKRPDLGFAKDFKDFGKGFYLTTYLNQAEEWTNIQMHRGKPCNQAYIYEYRFDTDMMKDLCILELLKYDEAWYEFIKEKRKKTDIDIKYDLIYDRMADYPVLKAIEKNMSWGTPCVQESITKLCRKEVDKDQYCFKTEKSLELLLLQRYADVRLINGQAQIVKWITL